MPVLIRRLFLIVFLVRRFYIHADMARTFIYKIFGSDLPFAYWT